MPPRGRRYSLVLYTLILDRWWKPILWIGIILLGITGGFLYLPVYLPAFHLPELSTSSVWTLGGIASFAILLAIYLVAIRRSAYVQPFGSYLRLSTPFMRFNISYRRIRQASSIEMGRLFPPERFRGWKRKFLQPLAGHTVIVLDMSGWPMSRQVLLLFLSPFFFPDKTARMVLLIPHWMEFSTELESLRGTWLESARQAHHPRQPDLYAQVIRPH